MKKNIVIQAALLLGFGTAFAFAADAKGVLSDLHKSNQMEIRMGKLAQEKGQSADTRSFGEKLVKDHQAADDKVKALADKQGITLEPTNSVARAMENHEVSDLSKKSGADFDKSFAQAMVKDHEKDISDLQKDQQALAGSPTADLIASLLPTLQDHLQTAQKLSSAQS